MKGIDAYPLQWPEGWQRTAKEQRQSSRYQVSQAQARNDLFDEARKLVRRSSDVVVSTNVRLKGDGLPYANEEPSDPGVAVYWLDDKGEQKVIACDGWATVRENMRAVSLAVSALRQLKRCKATEILDRAFQGFAALPQPGREEPWWKVFGLSKDEQRLWRPSRERIEEIYRELAKDAHPDRPGGSHGAMLRLNKARDAALADLGDA